MSALHSLVRVEPLGGHRLRLRFDDGVEGEVDLARRLTFDGVFAPLRDPKYFARVRVHPEAKTLCWPNHVDLDNEVLYSLVTGRPIIAGGKRRRNPLALPRKRTRSR